MKRDGRNLYVDYYKLLFITIHSTLHATSGSYGVKEAQSPHAVSPLMKLLKKNGKQSIKLDGFTLSKNSDVLETKYFLMNNNFCTSCLLNSIYTGIVRQNQCFKPEPDYK